MSARRGQDPDKREVPAQRGQDSYEQEKESYLEEEGLPDLHDARPEEEVLLPRDFPQGVDEHGTTAAEQREGESLEQRVGREEPELPLVEEIPHGRLVKPESGVDEVDATPEMVASEEEGDRAGLSAEEQAVHEEES
jgi:hypothetical protein